MRARDYGITVGEGTLGRHNAITDVTGIRVGHTTLIQGEGPLLVGAGPARTGVTAVLPPGQVWDQPLFAGAHRLNGNGELTGLEWVRESGLLTSPVGLTNTHSVGTVRDALIAHIVEARPAETGHFWALPVVGETWDGLLNDLNGFHVHAEHVHQAIATAADGPVAEGGVGSGTGMGVPRVQRGDRYGFSSAPEGRGRLHRRRTRAGQLWSTRTAERKRSSDRARDRP